MPALLPKGPKENPKKLETFFAGSLPKAGVGLVAFPKGKLATRSFGVIVGAAVKGEGPVVVVNAVLLLVSIRLKEKNGELVVAVVTGITEAAAKGLAEEVGVMLFLGSLFPKFNDGIPVFAVAETGFGSMLLTPNPNEIPENGASFLAVCCTDKAELFFPIPSVFSGPEADETVPAFPNSLFLFKPNEKLGIGSFFAEKLAKGEGAAPTATPVSVALLREADGKIKGEDSCGWAGIPNGNGAAGAGAENENVAGFDGFEEPIWPANDDCCVGVAM